MTSPVPPDLPDAIRIELAAATETGPVPDDPVARDQYFMRLALVEAAKAFAEDEVPVGCVVVKDNAIIGRGYNLRETRQDPTAHAEVIAMVTAAAAQGRWMMQECELFVTLEPCPMCAGALVNARIGRVIYAADDPKAGACGSVLDLSQHAVLNHRYPVTRGVLADAGGLILTEFFRRKRR